MKILRVFNNSVVLACASDGEHVVVTGRGVGFGAKPGDPVDQTRVAKVFVPEGGRNVDNFGALVAAIAPEHLVLADRALDMARRRFDIRVGSTTVIALADHIGFALARMRRDIAVSYPLRAEVIHLYPDEYEAARSILDLVNDEVEYPLPADEAVSIALHLVNAGFVSGDLSVTYEMTNVFTQLFAILEAAHGRRFDMDTVNAARFITHLRYFFVRARAGNQLSERTSALRNAIRDAYSDAHTTAVKLQAVLELRLGVALTDDEVTYLTMHIARMVEDTRVGVDNHQ